MKFITVEGVIQFERMRVEELITMSPLVIENVTLFD